MQRARIVSYGLLTLLSGSIGCTDDKSHAGADAAQTDDTSRAGNHSEGDASATHDASTGPARDASAPHDAGSEPNVTLRFKGVVGDRDFACGETYEHLGTSKVAATPVDFRFFIQDVKLIAKNGDEVDVEIPRHAPFQDEGVALIDFTDGSGECTGDDATNTEIAGRAPAGEYTGIVFSVGVPEELNHQDIALANPPLTNAGLSWGWLLGYRFLLAQIDPVHATDEDAGVDDAGVGDPSSLIHIGSGGCKGSTKGGFTCSRPNRSRVRLTGFDPTHQAVLADFAGVFVNSDLRVGKQCHGADTGCDGVFRALGIAIGSGAPLDTQSLFKSP